MSFQQALSGLNAASRKNLKGMAYAAFAVPLAPSRHLKMRQINPLARRLLCPWVPMMMWSCTAVPSGFARNR